MIIAIERLRSWTVTVIGRLPDLGLDVRTSPGLGARPNRPTKKPNICPRSFSALSITRLPSARYSQINTRAGLGLGQFYTGPTAQFVKDKDSCAVDLCITGPAQALHRAKSKYDPVFIAIIGLTPGRRPYMSRIDACPELTPVQN